MVTGKPKVMRRAPPTAIIIRSRTNEIIENARVIIVLFFAASIMHAFGMHARTEQIIHHSSTQTEHLSLLVVSCSHRPFFFFFCRERKLSIQICWKITLKVSHVNKDGRGLFDA